MAETGRAPAAIAGASAAREASVESPIPVQVEVVYSETLGFRALIHHSGLDAASPVGAHAIVVLGADDGTGADAHCVVEMFVCDPVA